MKRPDPINRFRGDEHGGGTIFSLFIFVTLAITVGIMVDATNAWRNRTLLSSVADIAAHAGAVELARGGDDAEVAAEAARLVYANLDADRFGGVIDPLTDVSVIHFDPETGAYDTTGPRNAVLVRLGRNGDNGNAVGTYLLRLAGFNSWDLGAVGAAVFDYSPICSAAGGIYAMGQVTLTSQTDVGAGFCIHSQDAVWLPQQNTFADGSFVSMPDLDDCKNKCTDSANPGIRAIESNKVLPDFAALASASYTQFKDPMDSAPKKQELFAPITDMSAFDAGQDPLIAAGILGGVADVGDVVTLTHADFHAMAELPSGLVYEVACPAGGNGPGTRLTFDGATAKMDKAALITNCSLDFQSGSSVVGSVVISTRDSSSAVLTSGSSVTIGDPAGSCDAEDRTVFMVRGKVSVPANFAMSNVTIMAGDDIRIASGTSSATTSRGIALYSSGEVHIASQHIFRTCGNDDALLTPKLESLRLIMPSGYDGPVTMTN